MGICISKRVSEGKNDGSKNVMLDLLLPMFLPDSLEFPWVSRLISYFRQGLSLSFDFIIFEEK